MKNHLFYAPLKSFLLMLPVLIYSTLPSAAQTQSVVSHTEMIGKVQRTGLKTSVAFSEKEVDNAWKSYLKSFGKVSSSKGQLSMSSAKIPQISDKPIRLLSKVGKESDNSTYVFSVFDMGAGYITERDSRYVSAESFMRDFAIKMYRDEYSGQIADAEKTFNNAQDAEKKLIEQDEQWTKEMQKAREEILDMENKIQERRSKIIDLERQLIDNQSSKRKAAEEVEQNRIIVEQMKSKLGDFN